MAIHLEFVQLLDAAAENARRAELAATNSAKQKLAAARAAAKAVRTSPPANPASRRGGASLFSRLVSVFGRKGERPEPGPSPQEAARREAARMLSAAKNSSRAASRLKPLRESLEEMSRRVSDYAEPSVEARSLMEEAIPFLRAACGKPYRMSTFAKAAEKARGAASAWVRSERARRMAAAPAAKPSAPPPPKHWEPIWLPIPWATGKLAAKAGAGYDPTVQQAGRWFVPPGVPVDRFEPWLPLAYRREPPELTFPPIRHQASSQNLWSVFDRHSWDQIRHINYERTGRRCVLCGKQSGRLAEALGVERVGSVDCHEVWEWSVPDPEVALGIQRLKGMLVVCFECHMTFHEGYAREIARRLGIEGEVREYLMKQRAFLTRKDPRSIAMEMVAEREALRRHSGVRTWLMDLSHLGRQDYMHVVRPVFMEDNAVGVQPGQVAGLSFVTDRGARWPATSAEELYGRMADLYRIAPLKIVQTGRALGR